MLQIVLIWLDYITYFSYYLLLGFRALIFYNPKIWNNIVESLFCIPGASAENKDNLMIKLIVQSNIGLLL